jgi:hypothetical protein
MNSGNSVQDADPRVGPDAPSQDADLAVSDSQKSQPRPALHQVEDIQEIIDKLAAVNRRLRYPRHSDS